MKSHSLHVIAFTLEGQLGAMRGSQAAADTPAKPFHATAVEVGKP